MDRDAVLKASADLSEDIQRLQSSIWDQLTTENRQRCIAELDQIWSGRGWLPPWNDVDNRPCTAENIASADILNLATITRVCSQNDVDLVSLWQPGGYIYDIAVRNTTTPVWSHELSVQSVRHCVKLYGLCTTSDVRDKRRKSSSEGIGSTSTASVPPFDQDGSNAQSNPDRARNNPSTALPTTEDTRETTSSNTRSAQAADLSHAINPRKRQRVNSQASPSIPQRQLKIPSINMHDVTGALAELNRFRDTLRSFEISLQAHFDKLPRADTTTLEANLTSSENDVNKAREHWFRAEEDSQASSEAHRSLLQTTPAARQYREIRRWLDPVLSTRPSLESRDGASSQNDADFQKLVDGISTAAQAALHNYSDGSLRPETIEELRAAEDRTRMATQNLIAAQETLVEAQHKIEQLKALARLETEKARIKQMLDNMKNSL